MADEVLRLEASVIDRFSKPLRDLRNGLRDIKTPDTVRQMHSDFYRVETAVKSASKSLSGGLGQAMSALSLPSLAATASVTGLIGAIRSLSGSTIELKAFSRETGISIQTLKAFERASGQFGVNADAVAPALKRFSDNLYLLKRHQGNWAELHRGAPELVDSITKMDPDKAAQVVENYLAKLKDRTKARMLSQDFFGTDEMARYGARGPEAQAKALREAYSANAPNERDEARAAAFEESITKLQKSFGALSKTVAAEVTPQLTAVMNAVDAFMKANQGKIGTGVSDAIKSLSDSLKETDWKEVGDDVKAIGAAIKSTMDALRLAVDPNARAKKQREGGAADVRRENEALEDPRVKEALKAKPPTPAVPNALGNLDAARKALLHKSSFGGEGFGGLFHRASLGGSDDALTTSVKEGFLAAFRELMMPGADKGSSGGGLMNASFGGGGGFGGGGYADGTSAHAAQRAARELGGGRGSGGPIDARGATAVSKNLPPEARAFLDDIASGEAKGYNVINGGAHFDDYSHHPFGTLSTRRGGRASGRYQFLPSTWAAVQRATGLKDFGPESQDKGAWYLAQSRYRALTHRDLLGDLRNGDRGRIAMIGRVLHPTWTSLNRAFGPRYEAYLRRLQNDRVNPHLADDHGIIARHNGGPVPMPKNMPKPGDLLKKQEHRSREPSRLEAMRDPNMRIELVGFPKHNVKTSPGDFFNRIEVARGRTMIAASGEA